MKYPRDVSNELYARLEAKRERQVGSLQGTPEEIAATRSLQERIRPAPTPRILGQLLDMAFFASIVQEEGHSPTFSLLYIDQTLARESTWPCIHFDSPLPFSVETIRKLSPATDPAMVDIGVDEIDGTLLIWGLVYVRQSQPGSRSHPIGLTLSVRQPGVLIVGQEFDELMIYTPGKVEFVDKEHYLGSLTLWSLVSKALTNSPDFRERLRLAARLVDMASIALDQGHGATFLIIPSDKDVVALDLSRYRADTASRQFMASVFLDPDRIYVSRAMARTAFVDGAVVIDEKGTFLGFGAMIRTEQVADFGVVVINPVNPTTGPTHISLSQFSGGSRHRSALVFAYLNPGALVLVVSHDGVMSVITRPIQEEFVAVMRPYQRGMDLAV